MRPINTINGPLPLRLKSMPIPRHDKGSEKPPRVPPLLTIDIAAFKHIVLLLYPVDRACLALTCKPLLNTLGRSTISITDFPLDDRLAFLQHQTPHFPAHILCHWCGLFHLRAAITSTTAQHICGQRGSTFNFPAVDAYTLLWQDVSPLIREIQTGTLSRPIDGPWPWPPSVPFRASQTIEHRVAGGKLLIRTHLRISEVRTPEDIRAVAAQNSIMCPHQNYLTLGLLRRLEREHGPVVYECMECRACMMYQVSEAARGWWELQCVVWICVGDGASPIREEWVRAVRCDEKYYPARKVRKACQTRTWVMYEWMGVAASGEEDCEADDADSITSTRGQTRPSRDGLICSSGTNKQQA